MKLNRKLLSRSKIGKEREILCLDCEGEGKDENGNECTLCKGKGKVKGVIVNG